MPAGEGARLPARIDAVTVVGATAVAKAGVAGANPSAVVGDAGLSIDRLRAMRPDPAPLCADAVDLGSPTPG